MGHVTRIKRFLCLIILGSGNLKLYQCKTSGSTLLVTFHPKLHLGIFHILIDSECAGEAVRM